MIGIYKITNQINGRCYIGQSSDIEYRFSEHKRQYNYQGCAHYHLYKAFRKYGLDNFDFSVIEECDQSLLNERERFWIKHYDSFKNGYNMTLGGEGTEQIERSDIYRLWDGGLTVSDIAIKIGCSPITVSRIVCSYDGYDKKDSAIRGKLWHRKSVTQYGLDGRQIRNYDSILDASEATGVHGDCISACCNKRLKSAGGYQWSFESKENIERYDDIAKPRIGKRKSILQYTTQNELIGEYKNISDAQRQTGVGRLTISRVCNGVQKYGGGFIWKFAS